MSVSGCSLSPHNHIEVEQAKDDSQSINAWQNNYLPNEASTATTLNELIDSSQLDALITQALKANPSFQQTLLTLKTLQAQQKKTLGAQLPELTAGFSATRSKSQVAQTISNSYTGSASVSWQLDLWGKLANTDEAAVKDIQAQAWAVQAARNTLVGNVTNAWLKMIALQHNIGIYQLEVSTYEKQAEFLINRYRSGLSSLEDLDTVKISLASAKATVEIEKQSMAQAKQSMAVLLGRTTPPDIKLDRYPNVLLSIAKLPNQTLSMRPDLQEAYSIIESKNLSSQVAYKDLLPTISLGATLQDIANSPSKALFTNPVWSLLGNLTAPLYKGGQLRAQAEIADLQVAQAYQSYRNTLLNAVQDVENALFAEKSLDTQYQHVTDALSSAERSLQHYQRKYREGLVDLLDVITIQQKTFALRVQQENLVQKRLSNRVTLGLALGLSWQIDTLNNRLSQKNNEEGGVPE